MESNNAGSCWFEEMIQALDEERQKVEVFHRELPLSLRLINQTIESYKQLKVTNMSNPREQDRLIAVKELISQLRPSSMSSSDEEDTNKQLGREEILGSSSDQAIRRPTLELFTRDEHDRSFSSPEMIWRSDDSNSKGNEDAGAANINGGEGDDDDGEDIGSDGEEDLKKKDKKAQYSKRKVRRFWSEELHERFLLALEQLGGCNAATPKRIRKLMKVEGLTNDEIKSHLQKFRISKRRTNPILDSRIPSINKENNIEASNFAVVVRGIWIPTMDSRARKFPPPLVALKSSLMLGNENFQLAKQARIM